MTGDDDNGGGGEEAAIRQSGNIMDVILHISSGQSDRTNQATRAWTATIRASSDPVGEIS